MTENTYKIAYERERQARLRAEFLLDEKTRELYQNVVSLEEALADLKATQKKLIQSEKMASIGQVAAGVAHEINNPLGFSLSNVSTFEQYCESLLKLESFVHTELPKIGNEQFVNQYLALRKEEDIDFIHEDSNEIIESTLVGLMRIKKIVASLKNVTHQSISEKKLCNINDCIRESLDVVWNELKYGMEVECHYGHIPPVLCESSEIHQVLMNMFINAKHACDNKGKLDISTSRIEKDDQSWVAIQIKDDGRGIASDSLDKIFEPFYTTKPVGKGTGLGLSVSHGLIRSHGGKIEVTSIEGEGTTFTILLKICSA
ncbi:sensor histidine kinase [Psychrobium sp. 1_MG-2023]|uniref:sensor histidine kinase n=1 Tax=Psychrobium sp. 1_MG-2023 TaxID=3062624 RepID=UPI000C32E0DB|nr:ATP-binding protein [Psychrobium sp. 1_MG-2023]MDP2561650.1 ATP-binding protein [Psychrobium sp. 1_MG-2023]PKF55666.1 histidine kinase [Alteromonadales bacterium alter-6D02]